MNKKIYMTTEMCNICTETIKLSSAKKNTKIWSKELCDECKKRKELGFVLVGVVEEKTTDVTSPYRSGNIYVVKREAAQIIFMDQSVPASGVAFVDVKVLQQCGLPGVNMNA